MHDRTRHPIPTTFAARVRARVAQEADGVHAVALDQRLLREARALLRQVTAPAERCWALLLDASALSASGQWVDAAGRLAEAVERADGAPDPLGHQEALRLIGEVAPHVDDPRRLTHHAALVARSAHTATDPTLGLHAGYALARIEESLGEVLEARARLERLCDALTPESPRAVALRIRLAAARAAMDDDSCETALAHLDAARSVAGTHPDPRVSVEIEQLTGHALHALGRSDQALEHLRHAATEATDPTGAIQARLMEAEALCRLGSPEPALEALRAADTLAERAGLPHVRYQVAVRMAALFAQQERWREAWEHQAEAAVWRERTRSPPRTAAPDTSIRQVADQLRHARDAALERAEQVEQELAAAVGLQTDTEAALQVERAAFVDRLLRIEHDLGAALGPLLALCHGPHEVRSDGPLVLAALAAAPRIRAVLEEVAATRRGPLAATQPIEDLDVADVLAEVLGAWQPVAAAHDVPLTATLAPGPTRVSADRSRLVAALSALIGHAVLRGAAVHVRAAVERGRLRVHVPDAPRPDSGRHPGAPGPGAAKVCARRLGGALFATSDALVLDVPVDHEGLPDTRTARIAPSTPAALRPPDAPRALLIEPNPIQRALIARMLAHAGLDTTTVSDPAAAADALDLGPWSAILMDGALPDEHVACVASHLEEAEAVGDPVAVLAFTDPEGGPIGYVTPHPRVDDLVPRPVALDSLLSLLDRWLPGRSPRA